MNEIPVRDENPPPSKKRSTQLANFDHYEQQAIRERQQLARWDRAELEDKYIRQQEDNLTLKRHTIKLDEKLKKMAVKLVRLNQDKKRAEMAGGSAPLKKAVKDSNYEDKMDELSSRLRQAELDKKQLVERLTVLQNQLDVASATHKNQTYQGVPSRIDTGVKKDTIKKGLRVVGPTPRTKQSLPSPKSQPQLPRYGHSLLEEARDTNLTLGYELEQLKHELDRKDSVIEQLKEMHDRDNLIWEERLLELKQTQGGMKRSETQENIDLIRLKRELKDKESKLISVTSQYESLQANITHLKTSHDVLLRQLEDATNQLKQEQSRSVALQSQIKRTPPELNRITELEEQMSDYKKENSILKEANENLVSSAFDMEREREWRQRENALKVQIAQLEATLKADLGEKGNILDRLTAEREAAERSDKQQRELQREYYKLKEQHDELKEKMKFFTKESAIDFAEIEEALMLVKQKKEQEHEQLDFIHKVDEQKSKDVEKEMMILQADHAETIEELEKTRNMLIVQHQINKDYQLEVEAINRKMEENKLEYESKLDEYAQLLDIRAARIRKLETQLKDVAYGTRQYKVNADEEPATSDVEEIDETIQLERGENLFEIHIGCLDLTKEAVNILEDQAPSLFCTWEFFEFETQATPVVKAPNPMFDFTSLYVVRVDDFFLHYLQKESTVLEVHMALGTEFKTVGTCRLKFKDLFEKNQGKVQRIADVISVERQGVLLGQLGFWVRLKVPMDQALRLYKERMKALGYISANEKVEHSTLQALDESANQKPPDNVNTLKIKLLRCKNLQSRRKDVQPSPYCVYKFFDFPDHDTELLSSTNNPEFNDLQAFPVNMAADLDHYLKSVTLEVYVFDDTDPELASYLGAAKIPLLSLAHDKAIKGTFELKSAEGVVNGSMDIILEWQYTYIPPPIATRTAAQMVSSTPVKRESLAMMEGESLDVSSVAASSPIKSQRRLDLNMEDSLQPLAKHRDRKSPPTVIRKSPKKNKTVEFSANVTQHTIDPSSASDSEDTQMIIKTRPPPATVQPEAPSIVATPPQVDESLDADRLIREELGEASEATEPTITESAVETQSVSEISIPQSAPPIAVHEQRPQPAAPPRPGVRELSPPAPTPAAEIRQSVEIEDDDTTEVTDSIDEEEQTTQGPASSQQLGESAGTYFEESEDEDTLNDEEAEVEGHEEADEEQSITSDSDAGVVTPAPKPARELNSSVSHGDIVVIEVGHISLYNTSPVLKDPAVKRLFVAYNFLGINPAELETPVSLPKPKNERQQLVFNFRKVFHVDMENNYERRQYLASMLLPNAPDNGRVYFSIVCEPPEDDETSDCFDIGVAYISLPDVLKQERDLENVDLTVMDAEEEKTEIGILNVSVQCLSALQAIKDELPTDL